jgi:hypothetical protein
MCQLSGQSATNSIVIRLMSTDANAQKSTYHCGTFWHHLQTMDVGMLASGGTNLSGDQFISSKYWKPWLLAVLAKNKDNKFILEELSTFTRRPKSF